MTLTEHEVCLIFKKYNLNIIDRNRLEMSIVAQKLIWPHRPGSHDQAI